MALSVLSKRRGPTAAAFLVVLQVGVSLVPSSRAAELFGNAAVYLPVGQDPSGIVVADLNGDDRVDLAVTNRASDSVSILLGDGLGAFSPTPDIVGFAGPEAVTAADFDADGQIDLAVVNRDNDSVTILLGNGDGTFNAKSDVLVGTSPVAVAAAELSGDEQVDLVVVNRDDNSVSILRGVGGGDFSQALDFDVGAGPLAVTVGDFDGDGQMDLAVVNQVGDSVSVLFGEGLGVFSPASEIDVGAGPEAIAAGEFNGDAQLDLAVANHDVDTVSILLWDALLGEFAPGSIIEVGDGPAALTVSDFNADGIADLGVANPSLGIDTIGGDGSVTILLGLGDPAGGFLRTLDIDTAQHPPSLAAGDFDGDGASDLAVINQDSESVSILRGNGLGGFSQTPKFDVGQSPKQLGTGDFNGDGVLDLAVGNSVDTLDVSLDLLVGDGLGGFLFDPEGSIPVGPPLSIAIGDFDGNGLSDLAYGDGVNFTISVLLNDGEGGFETPSVIDVGIVVSPFALGDLNADGNQDLVVTDLFLGKVFILLGNGTGTFSTSDPIDVGNGPVSAAVGDFNGDGVADLAVANLNSDTVSILLGDGFGGFSREPDLVGFDAPFSVAVGDFDANNQADLAVANHGSNTVSIFLGDGQGNFPDCFELDVGRGPSYVAVGDFNNDGAADLIVANELSGSVSVLLSNGEGGFLQMPDIGVGEEPASIALGDFDADGRVDAVVANFGSNSISILSNRIFDRADVNGSNRIDGFDIAAIGRLCGIPSTHPSYERNVDVNLDGMIDGVDLDLVCARFGELRKVGSPLRAVLNPLPAGPDTVTLQSLPSEGDLLTIRVLVNDSGFDVTGADFAVTYGPADGDPSQVLELLDGFTPGSYLHGGGFGQVFSLNRATPGVVEVVASRIPENPEAGSGEQPLMDLFFRALREGDALLEFAPFQHSQATLLCTNPNPLLCPVGPEVTDISFSSEPVSVQVEAAGEDPIAQRVGVFPKEMDFGALSIGTTSSRTLRISNFGFADVDVLDVTSTVFDFTSFFGAPFTISQFGFVELTVEYSAKSTGFVAGELLIELGGPGDVEIRVPLSGTGL